MHNAIQRNIDFDNEHDNEIAQGDVAVISNLKNRVDFNGTFGLVRVYIPSKHDVANAAKNLVRVTAKELGGNLRWVLSNIEYAEVCAVLGFLSRHLDFVGGGEEDEDDSEGSSPRNRTRERRPPDPSPTPGKRRKVKSPEEDR